MRQETLSLQFSYGLFVEKMEDSSESEASDQDVNLDEDQELVAESEESQDIIWSSKFTRKKR